MTGEVVINNPDNVTIGGVGVGAAADAIKNIPDRASDIQRALTAYWSAQQKATTDTANTHKAELDAAKAAADAAVKAATDPLNAQIATLQATIKTNEADLATANARIVELSKLQAANDALTAQLAGKAGEYKITPTAMHEVAIKIAGGAEWLNGAVTAMLDGVVNQNQQALLEVALAKFPSLEDKQKETVLGIFDAPYLTGQPLETQLAALRDFGLTRFLALEPETQAAIAAMMVA